MLLYAHKFNVICANCNLYTFYLYELKNTIQSNIDEYWNCRTLHEQASQMLAAIKNSLCWLVTLNKSMPLQRDLRFVFVVRRKKYGSQLAVYAWPVPFYDLHDEERNDTLSSINFMSFKCLGIEITNSI